MQLARGLDGPLNLTCAAVEHLRAQPGEKGGMAPVYGLAATLPMRGMVSEMLKRYMDLLYKV